MGGRDTASAAARVRLVLRVTGLDDGMTALVGGGTLYLRPHWRRRLERLGQVAPGCPIHTLGVGLDGLYDAPGEALAWGKVEGLVRPIGARGPRTASALISAGIPARIVGDSALLAAPDREPSPVEARRVFVNVADVEATNADENGYVELVDKLAAAGWAVEVLQVWDQDSGLARRVALRAGVACRNVEVPSSAAVAMLAEARVVVATRLHAAVVATCGRVPTVSWSYHDKCQDYLESIGCGEWSIPAATGSPEDVVTMVERLDDSYDGARRHLDVEIRRQQTVLRSRVADVRQQMGLPALPPLRLGWKAAVDAHGFLFVSDRIPLPTLPTGFVDRYSGFLHGLAARAPTGLVVGTRRALLDATGVDGPSIREQLVDEFPELDHVDVRPIRAPRSGRRRVTEPARALARPRLANTSIPELDAATRFPGILIVTHSAMAHLGVGRRARGLHTVYLLEEGFERAPRNESALTPTQRRKSAMTHAARRTLIVHRLLRRVDAEGDPVVVMSPEEESYFSRWIRRSPIVVLPDSVRFPDDRSIHAAARNGSRSGTPSSVGVFGRLGDDRNALATIALLELAHDPGSRGSLLTHPLRWLIVGSNPPPTLSALASDTVTVTGYVPDMGPYYERADIAVVPATSVTGNKSTLLKAWSYGLPVVISAASASAMPVRHEVNAIVADSTAGMLRAIDRLCRDADLRDRIAREGHRTACDFESARVAARFVELAGSGSIGTGDRSHLDWRKTANEVDGR